MFVDSTERPSRFGDSLGSLLLGVTFAFALFVMMALAQMMGSVDPAPNDVSEEIVAFVAPDLDEIEEEPPLPPEKEEAPPELEHEAPLLSLAQLDLALNPGTGGSLTGDFAMPTIGSSPSDLGTEDFVDFSDLDRIPRPIGVSGLNFPRHLLKKRVDGKIVLLVRLDEEGGVVGVEIESSNLPEFDRFIRETVGKWNFTPPTLQGRPVKASARLPIPIRIS